MNQTSFSMTEVLENYFAKSYYEDDETMMTWHEMGGCTLGMRHSKMRNRVMGCGDCISWCEFCQKFFFNSEVVERDGLYFCCACTSQIDRQ